MKTLSVRHLLFGLIFTVAACGGSSDEGSSEGSSGDSPAQTPTPSSAFQSLTTVPIGSFQDGLFYNPELAVNEAGKTLLVYSESGYLYGTSFDGTTQAATMELATPGEYALWTGKTHQVVVNESGMGGVVFRGERNSNGDHFGFAYFDGNAWTYSTVMLEGSVDLKIAFPHLARKSKIIGVDSRGVVYVAFTASNNHINVARFDSSGLVDIDELDALGLLAYIAVNKNNEVMVLAGNGSQIWNGSAWSNLAPPPAPFVSVGTLFFNASGTADYVDHNANILSHFHFDGTSWTSFASDIDGPGGFSWGSAAITNTGTATSTWLESSATSDIVYGAYFNGVSWNAPQPLDTNATSFERAPVFADNAGRFLVITVENQTEDFIGYYFDGTWHGPHLIQAWTYGSLDPAIAMNGAGHLVIASDKDGHDNLSVIFSRFAP